MTLREWMAADYLRHLLVLWRSAHYEELLEDLPSRTHEMRLNPKIPEAYTVEEVRPLVAAAKRLEVNNPQSSGTKVFLNQPRMQATPIQHKKHRLSLSTARRSLCGRRVQWPTLIWKGYALRHFPLGVPRSPRSRSSAACSRSYASRAAATWRPSSEYGSVHLGYRGGSQVTPAPHLDPRIVRRAS